MKVNHLSLPYVFKSISILVISNIYATADRGEILPDTLAFALESLRNWRLFLSESSEPDSIHVIKNLVYSSLLLFYNMLQKSGMSTKAEEKSQH